MPRFDQHIPEPELQSFLSGETRDILRNKTIEGHLAVCPECQAVAQRIPADSLERKLRSLHENAVDGIRLAERFEIIEELGRGGAGIVYRARQPGLEREIALKMIAGGIAGSGETERFRREAAALGKIRHPNVVRIFDFGEQDGMPFIAMELIEGHSLEHWIRQNVLAPPVAASVVRQLADAMIRVHQLGILHRDIKPGNILMDIAAGPEQPQGSSTDRFEPGFPPAAIPKLTDFGLSLFMESSLNTRTGFPMGTPSYMPPELATGDRSNTGPPTDVYGLGSVLYHALTGRPPFVGETTAAVLRSVIEDDVIPICQLRPDVPRDLATVCENCLIKETSRRLPSAEFLRDELDRFLSGVPIRSRPVPASERLRKWIVRNPWRAAAMGLVAGGLTALVALSLVWNSFLARQRDAAAANYETARQTVWKILDASRNESVFRVPELNQLVRAQTQNAMPLFEQLAREEKSAGAQMDLVHAKLLMGSLLAGAGEFEQARSWLESVPDTLAEMDAQTVGSERLRSLIDTQIKLAVVMTGEQENDAALAILNGVQPLVDRLIHAPDCQLVDLERRAWLAHNRANVRVNAGDPQAAIADYQQAIADRQQVLDLHWKQGSGYSEREIVRRLVESRMSLGVCQMSIGELNLAADLFHQSIAGLESLLQTDPDDFQSMLTLAATWLNLSNLDSGQDRVDEAIADCTRGIQQVLPVAQVSPENHTAAHYLSMLYGNRALFQMNAKAYQASLADWAQAEQHAVVDSTRKYCHAMWIRNLIRLQRTREARQALLDADPESWSPDNAFVAASNWAMLASRNEPLAIERLTQMMQHLKSLAFFRDNDEVRKMVMEDEDFAVFRQQFDENELQAWFE